MPVCRESQITPGCQLCKLFVQPAGYGSGQSEINGDVLLFLSHFRVFAVLQGFVVGRYAMEDFVHTASPSHASGLPKTKKPGVPTAKTS